MEVGFLQETKSILKSLVLSSPNSLTLERLNRDYREMVGNWIPFQKLGFPNLELFLRSIPDTLVVTGHGLQANIGFVSNEKVKHINEMVSRQKNATRDRKSAVVQNTTRSIRVQNIHPPPCNVTTYKQPNFNATFCGFSKYNSNPSSRSRLNNTNGNIHRNDKNSRPQGTNLYRDRMGEDSKANKNSQTFSQNKSYSHSKHSNNTANDEIYYTKSNSKNSEEYKEKNGSSKEVSYQKNSVNILCKPNNSGKGNNDSDKSSNMSKETTIEKRLSSEKVAVKCDKNKNMQICENTKNCSERSITCRGKENNFTSNGIIFPSKTVLPRVIPQNTERKQINEKTISEMQGEYQKRNIFSQNDTIENDDDIDEAVPEFAANGVVFRVDFPEHTVRFGQKIPKLKLPEELVKGAVVGVFISEIHSPFKFWFHIYKENHELDILMNRIECFYQRLSINEFVIPKNCLAPGHICAALYNDMWHRAEVLTNVCNNKVKVNFFDYGTVTEIDIHNIKYLPEIFSYTPMQAIRGSLSHIKPIASLWPKSAVRAFLSMVSDVLLYAQIMDIDEKEQTAYMVLCDTNGSETVQINRQMVEKGYAKLDSEWDENKIAKNGYRKRHPRDIFPTFEMLETGEYPSLSELENLLAQGIDYENLPEKIILCNVNNNNEPVLSEDCSQGRNYALSFDLLDTNPFKSDIISEIVSLKIFDD